MKKKIVTDLNFLRQKSEKVNSLDVKGIVKDLEDTLADEKGVGLSAVQIGILKRVAIVRIEGKENIDLINPVILEKRGKFRNKQEGCLSIPGLHIDTMRYEEIILNNDGQDSLAYGAEAMAIQHEVDHMNGLLMMDKKWRKRR